ncbi:CRP/FNR family transcriptional regulator [Neolewinella xylanilytica]|uniref:CRP/FNR family transcriptional regulator n=1 Tax=Neolewinella xylanilytica TaxID=1514080 RepID=A0A2S6IA38_9BACT|nr:Crp/Fnr family transcriptional regulator [Neolewinella xylanilytica]PPK88342.1 CRP/FNR family transcriptional regulator [Neolewinella xylanilytica]
MNDRLTTEDVHRYFPEFVEPGLLQVIANEGRIHRFAEGGVIMDYGNYVRMLPLILEGTIKISRQADDGSELFLYYLTRGESCAMTFSCCMAAKRSEIRAVAEEDTVILGLPQPKLDEWMMRYKSWKNFVMQAYDQRMNELVRTIDQVAFQQLDERLADYVSKRAAIREDRTILSTHQAIADDLHVSREAISRLLKTMENRGMVALGRNRITLLQPS